MAGDDKLDSRHLLERFLDVAKALELRLHLEHSVVAALVEEWRMGEVLQDCLEVSRPSFGKRRYTPLSARRPPSACFVSDVRRTPRETVYIDPLWGTPDYGRQFRLFHFAVPNVCPGDLVMPKASPVGIATFDQSRNGPDDRQQASTTIPDESLSRIFKVSSPPTRPDGAQAVFDPIRHVCTMAARLLRPSQISRAGVIPWPHFPHLQASSSRARGDSGSFPDVRRPL